jgi:hypothetical protein
VANNCKLEMKEEISALFCEVLIKQLGVVPNKVTTLIYSNNIIVFTTEYLKEQIQNLEQTRLEFENQRKHKLTRFEHYKPSIMKKIEKNFNCNIDNLEFFVGTNGIYLAHIILYEPLERWTVVP